MSNNLVAIDWGTSNLRAQLLDERGMVCDSFASDAGVGKLDRGGMSDEIHRVRERWPEASPDVLACGMIGSSLGWVEAPSLPCSAGLSEIAAALMVSDIDGVRLHIVPGARCRNADTGWDIMRGEELQAIGWASLQADAAAASGLCVMPGTHSKWIHMERGRIERFSTAMTGEIFTLLSQHSLLRHHIATDARYGDAFERGLAIGARQAGLARHLFSVRANALLEKMSGADAGSFVSGLLIGAELADALQINEWSSERPPVHLIGNRRLIDLYAKALAHFDIRSTAMDSGLACAAGFIAVHREMRKHAA